ncbi:MAG TPA: M3 family oligoendopeptidase [Candidatus Kapabacteria bacterium]|nr:M3 family oligoendopeptidase [Candidatus Kapabacteria bacterium]
MAYLHYPERPERLTAEFVDEVFEALIARIAEAEASPSADDWDALVRDWNAFRFYYSSEWSRVNFRLSANFSDEDAIAAEQYFRDRVIPAVDDREDHIVSALLDSRHRPELEARYGRYFFRRSEVARAAMASVNSDLRMREAELQNRYNRLKATAQVVVEGRAMTFDEAESLFTSPDRELRRQAYCATSEWILERRDELAGIFDELVAIRHRMALNLGYDDFTKLGYEMRERTDYGPADTARFRRNIFSHFLPINRALVDDHARRIGVDRLSVIDRAYDPDRSLPRGIAGPVETQLDRAARLFASLSPRLGEHFATMLDENLIDLPNRPGKYGGAFCTARHDEGRCAVLLNSVGDASDVVTLLHEMGHAFQNWESTGIELFDLRSPTSDVAEIHSTSMEFLGMRHVDELLPEEYVGRFRRNAWRNAVNQLVGIARADEFQHWIYEHPEATIDEREQMWAEMGERYSSGLDVTGYERYQRTSWYEIGHLFMAPFYMIDYALARLVSMQLALIDDDDHERAMAIYLELCGLGGTRSFKGAVEQVGLRSPFEEEMVAELAARVGARIAGEGEEARD